MRRRAFLAGLSAAGALAACGGRPGANTVPGDLYGTDDALGHRLRTRDFPAPSATRRVAVAIVGGGIGGLATGWKLARAGCDDFLLLEMEAEAGGNSRAGRNEVSSYPLGAHYLPLPTVEARAVRELLAELGVLQGDPADPAPRYDERYLCHAPQERLFLRGYWQEGLWPRQGVARAERDQYERFHDHIARYKGMRDARGRKAFALPLADSGDNAELLALDRITLRDWLLTNGFDSPHLHWLCDYACRDDYGTASGATSAWAGLHYFACRDGVAKDAASDIVLTAPEGNAWLARGLARRVEPRILPAALVYRVADTGRRVECDVFLPREGRSLRIVADQLVWAAPLFLIPQVFVSPPTVWLAAARQFDYAPWLVANLTLDAPPLHRGGATLAWDNVLYDSPSLGYVVATHQNLRVAPAPTVLTWYRSLSEMAPDAGRRRLRDTSHAAWAEEILAELARPHPELRDTVRRIDIHRNAHAMIRPVPGTIWGGARRVFAADGPRIRFAHGDVSGMSLFEEAQYRGVLAAERTLRRLGVSFASSL